ncbi:MAG: class I SAM-dependent methyltransferase [Chitinophagaceae bacterium]|nr:class I SAM-dependent methyltransferase [Chitinophagaceae bacterium]
MSKERNYDSISPSAKSLLLMKGLTDIPYAREAAALMQGPEIFDLDFNKKDFYFWIRVMHFESRYWSIDHLLKSIEHNNILELSSGYSFRGLDMCKKEAVKYIDTDLPEVIATKKQMIAEFDKNTSMAGELILQPLNALDEIAFNKVVEQFGEGPVTIVNEGLLMYLNTEEKKQLCRIIHSVLKARGGYWITADIYPKRSEQMRNAIPQSKSEIAFHEQHRIEENKFDSFAAAEVFFKEQGFEMVREAEIDYKQLSSVAELVKVLPPEVRDSKQPPPKVQATWMLKAI